MAFKVWKPRTSRRRYESDIVRITNKSIYLSTETIQKCFKGAKKVTLYWDEDRGIVGMMANGTEGLVLSNVAGNKDSHIKVLRWQTFVLTFKIHLDKPVDRKLVTEGEMWTFKP